VKEYKYPWTRQTPGCLEWDHRKSLIVDKLLGVETKADIVCLQEAQVDLFADLLTSLSPFYDGVMQNVTGDHNVGMCSSNVTNKSLLVKNLLSI
jgi:mRNA deadenylase 3'-5' endonuclease subunit Ccr4